MSVILAIETSSEACSAALAVDGEIHQRFEIVDRGHSERILPMIDTLGEIIGGDFSRVDVIAFGRGPGSFTGVRISASVAQGLALALDRPVIPVSSLAALAQAVDTSKVLAARDARMGEIYWGCYLRSASGLMELSGEEHVSPPTDIRITADGKWIGAGSGFAVYGEVLSQQLGTVLSDTRPDMFPSASQVAILAEAYYQTGRVVPVEVAIPSYVRNNVAKKPVSKY